jgi:hypothetical protein
VVADTGLFDKDPGPERRFVVSASAHSVLTVDGHSFPIDDRSNAYGSGIVASGKGDGWFGIEGMNPLVRTRGVDHHRLFLYRPGIALVIVDRVRARARHRYSRYFQLGAGIAARDRGPSTVALRASGLHGELYDAPAPRAARRHEIRGRRHPLGGVVSPSFRVFRPRWTLRLDSRARSATYVTTLALDSRGLRAHLVGEHGSVTRLALTGPGERNTLRVNRSGSRLAIATGQ